jgi:hypothetical protein
VIVGFGTSSHRAKQQRHDRRAEVQLHIEAAVETCRREKLKKALAMRIAPFEAPFLVMNLPPEWTMEFHGHSNGIDLIVVAP